MFEWVHYQFPPRVYFEYDCTHKIGSMVKDLGQRVLLVTVRDEISNPDQLAVLRTSLERHTHGCIVYDDIQSTPSPDDLDTAAHFAKQSNADVILAYGSRHSLNAAKAIAMLANNEVFAADIAQSLPFKKAPLPLITVPSVPVLGEECSPAFSVYNEADRTNIYVSDPRLFPQLVFLDPEITTVLPTNELSAAGVAILAACVESILAKKANEITNSIALRALELITHNLVPMIQDSNNKAARLHVCLASILAGMAHSSSQLGLAYALGAATHNLTGIDFFAGVSIMLPHIMEYNLTTSAKKYVQIAKALDEEIEDITVIEAAIKAVEGVRKIYLELKVPQRLSDFEIGKAELPGIAEQAFSIPLSRNTPRELDKNEIETILIAAY